MLLISSVDSLIKIQIKCVNVRMRLSGYDATSHLMYTVFYYLYVWIFGYGRLELD